MIHTWPHTCHVGSAVMVPGAVAVGDAGGLELAAAPSGVPHREVTGTPAICNWRLSIFGAAAMIV